MLDAHSARPGPRTRTDVSVVLVADGGEPGLPAAVRAVLAALDRAACGEAGRPGAGPLRGDRLGGELVLAVRDLAALPTGAVPGAGAVDGLPRHDRRLRVVAAPGASGGGARNLGVAAARGRYLLLTTPDARVPERWVVALVEPLRTGHADLVAGAVGAAGSAGVPGAGGVVGVAGAVRGPGVGLPGAFPAASCGATRAVLEAVGFDDALGAGRYPDAAVTTVFREDAVGAGFRVQGVAGVPVEVAATPPARGRRRALAAAARERGRTTAYLDRHVRVRPARRGRLAVAVALGAAALRLAGLVVAGPSAARSAAREAVAREREALRLAGVPDRDRPRSPAGDVPGGAGGARAAVPVALVARVSVPPTVLPTPPAVRTDDRAAAGGTVAVDRPAAPAPPGRAAPVDAASADRVAPADHVPAVDRPAAPVRGVASLLWPSARDLARRRTPPGALPPRSAAAP